MGEEEMSKESGQKYVIDRNRKGQRKSVKQIYLAVPLRAISLYQRRFPSWVQNAIRDHRPVNYFAQVRALLSRPSILWVHPPVIPWYPMIKKMKLSKVNTDMNYWESLLKVANILLCCCWFCYWWWREIGVIAKAWKRCRCAKTSKPLLR